MSNKKYRSYSPKIVNPVLVETIIEPGFFSKAYIILLSHSSDSKSDMYNTYNACISELEDRSSIQVKKEQKYSSFFGRMSDTQVSDRQSKNNLQVAHLSDISKLVDMLTKNDFFANDLSILKNWKIITTPYYVKTKHKK